MARRIYKVRGPCVEIRYEGKSYPVGSEIEMDEAHSKDLLHILEPTGATVERPLVDTPKGKIMERRVWKRRSTDAVDHEVKRA